MNRATQARRPLSRLGCAGLALVAALFLLAMYIKLPLTIAAFRAIFYLWLPYEIGIGLTLFCANRVRRSSRSTFLPWFAATTALVLYMLVWAWGSVAGGVQVALYREVNPAVVAKPADTTAFRYMPKTVAANLAKSSNLSSDLQRGDLDPLVGKDGITRWITPLEPSGGLNVLFPSKKGRFSLVDVTGEPTPLDSPFEYVEGAWANSDFYWQAARRAPLSDVESDIYYVTDPTNEKQLVAVAPITSYTLRPWMGIFPVWVPQWNGDVIFTPDGQVRSLGSAEAQALLPKARLVPNSYAESVAESYGYRSGLWNRFWFNEGKAEIPPLAGNPMPFLVGSNWQTVLEPPGDNKTNAIAVVLTDNHTGATQIYEVQEAQALAGPNAITARMQGKLPNGQWNTNVLVEPISFFKGGQLWYMATTTSNNPDKQTEVANTVAMSASGGDPVWLANPQEVAAFLNGSFAGHAANTFLSAVPSTAPQGNANAPVPTGNGTCTVADLSGCNAAQLTDLIRRAAEQLQSQQGGR